MLFKVLIIAHINDSLIDYVGVAMILVLEWVKQDTSVITKPPPRSPPSPLGIPPSWREEVTEQESHATLWWEDLPACVC